MKKEKNILVITMFLNLLVASTKLLGGIMFGFSTLVADSLQSFSDFITDIIANIATKIGKKRANKKYPFGYGMIENIANLFIGILLFLLSIYIFIESFRAKETELVDTVFIILIVTIILKAIVILILYHYGKKLNSNSLMVSAKESATDLVASIIVLIVSILLLFKEKYPILANADIIGSIIISIIIFYFALKIIIENITYLMGINEENKEVLKKIENIIQENKLIKDNSIKLMKIGTYYNLYLTIELDDKVTLKQLFRLENKLKKELKQAKLKIRFIEIEPKEFD